MSERRYVCKYECKCVCDGLNECFGAYHWILSAPPTRLDDDISEGGRTLFVRGSGIHPAHRPLDLFMRVCGLGDCACVRVQGEGKQQQPCVCVCVVRGGDEGTRVFVTFAKKDP